MMPETVGKPKGVPVCFEGKEITEVCGVLEERCRSPKECLWRRPVGSVRGLGGDEKGTMEGSLPRER